MESWVYPSNFYLEVGQPKPINYSCIGNKHQRTIVITVIGQLSYHKSSTHPMKNHHFIGSVTIFPWFSQWFYHLRYFHTSILKPGSLRDTTYRGPVTKVFTGDPNDRRASRRARFHWWISFGMDVGMDQYL